MEDYGYFRTLKNDFDASQFPSIDNGATLRTLAHIVEDIRNGKITLTDLEDYLAKEKIGFTPLENRLPTCFGDDCYDFIYHVLQYLQTNRL